MSGTPPPSPPSLSSTPPPPPPDFDPPLLDFQPLPTLSSPPLPSGPLPPAAQFQNDCPVCEEEKRRVGVRAMHKKHDPDLCCSTCRYFQAADWYVRSKDWSLASLKKGLLHDVEPNLAAATLASSMVGFAESATIRARMIFTWMGTNLTYSDERVDKILTGQEQDAPNPTGMTLFSGTGICTDFAELYREMCTAVKVNCVTISGLTKDFDFSPLPRDFSFDGMTFADVITFIKKRNNSKLENRFLGHVWNVVWIDENEPKVVDITMAMGASNNASSTESNTSSIDEGFNPYYFNLSNSELALSHLPYWGTKSDADFRRDFYFPDETVVTDDKLRAFFRNWVTNFSVPGVVFIPPLEVTFSLAHSCIGLNSSKGMFYYTDIVGNTGNPSGNGNAKVYICIGCKHAHALQGVDWFIKTWDETTKESKFVGLDKVAVPSDGPTDAITRNTFHVVNNIKLDSLLPSNAPRKSRDIYIWANSASKPSEDLWPMARFAVLWPKDA